MIRLRDRIDIVERTTSAVIAAGVPAYVGTATAALTTASSGPGIQFETGLKAIIAPRDFNPALNAIRWRGDLYLADGAPMVHRRGPRDHHVTIPIRRSVD